ncbi:ParA family protein [Prevotella melaninogenica]|uniref:ParA family protein n=1 Tax=Prevotella melaninogenica TaxID=28132 RepID=A0ABS6Y8R0_9BACT|nr:ParA family protein [Prevotella melaninogenica]MBW4755463.1 ParA family protein [Prevotella melaninogenica]
MSSSTKIIAFANHKGGVGKTTTTASVGSILVSKGFKVLLIDLDAQANLTYSMKQLPDVYQSIYNILVLNESPEPYNVSKNLDLIPSSQELAMVDIQLSSVIARERVLSRALSPIKENYDFILMDCPPSLGVLTLNACTFATDIIIPLIAEVLPFKGLAMINEFISNVREFLNPEVHVSGVLITRWEKTKLTSGIEQELRSSWGDLIFKTKIRKNVTIAEAPLESSNIIEYAPKSNGAADYLSFTEELLNRLQ